MAMSAQFALDVQAEMAGSIEQFKTEGSNAARETGSEVDMQEYFTET
jgi:hypothetical protein